jgi:DNA-binding IclR family transcriptional regulator
MNNPTPRLVRSVERAIDAIEAIVKRGSPMTLAELAGALDAPKSTTMNIVRSLVKRRVLDLDARTKTYSLGLLLGTVASQAPRLDLRRLAKPHLAELSAATQEVVLLSTLDGNEITFIDKIDSSQPIRYIADVGTRRPLHCTAAGKLALAMQPAAQVDSYITDVGLRRHTDTTIIEPAKLKTELARIRARGYAVSYGEFIPDLIGVAAPVLRGPDGAFVAAIVVAGPAFRMRRRVRLIVKTARRVAGALSSEVGRFAAALDAAVR